MPVVGQFLGITVIIYYCELDPPHFRAKYADEAADCSIEKRPKIIAGKLPLRVTLMVLDWASRYEKELTEDWRLAAVNKPLNHIEGSIL